MSDLPILDELRTDLLAAMRVADAAPDPAPRRRALRSLLAAMVVLALVAASAAAATYYVLRASPIAPLEPHDVSPQQRVAPGTSEVLALRAADPDPHAPPWALRLARSQTGLVCSTVAQVVDGEFGIVGLDHRFRVLPEANADVCSAPDANGMALLGARVFDADDPGDVRTVAYGVGGPRLEAASVAMRGGPPQRVEIARGEGGFLVAARGTPEGLEPTVTLRWEDGRVRRRELVTVEGRLRRSGSERRAP